MAVKRNKADLESQKAELEKQVPEMPKGLIATRPILYLAKQYKAGDRLPLNNQEMAAAWIEAGSAVWRESGTNQFFP